LEDEDVKVTVARNVGFPFEVAGKIETGDRDTHVDLLPDRRAVLRGENGHNRLLCILRLGKRMRRHRLVDELRHRRFADIDLIVACDHDCQRVFARLDTRT